MTKSEFIRRRCSVLIKTMEKFVHPEEIPKIKPVVLLFVHELITDVNNLAASDVDDMNDVGKYGDTLLEDK